MSLLVTSTIILPYPQAHSTSPDLPKKNQVSKTGQNRNCRNGFAKVSEDIRHLLPGCILSPLSIFGDATNSPSRRFVFGNLDTAVFTPFLGCTSLESQGTLGLWDHQVDWSRSG